MKNEQVAIGIDIGGTNTKIGLFYQSGILKSFLTLPTPHALAPDLFIEQLSQECNKLLLAEFNIQLTDRQIVGVGVGAPMANYYTGRVEEAPNLGWKNVHLKKLFQDKFKIPTVIENDANLAALGEKKWGAGKDLANFILVTLGTGVGTGLILNEKLYRGHNALGAEGGHIILPHEKRRVCSCGGMNHLESYLSAKGIKQTIHELTGQSWSIEQLGEKLKIRDQKAIEIVDTIAAEFAKGLSSMAVLLAPQSFIIGGGVSKLGERFNKVVLEKFDELVHYSLKGKVKIIPATLSSDKGAVYGGAAHIIDEVLS